MCEIEMNMTNIYEIENFKLNLQYENLNITSIGKY